MPKIVTKTVYTFREMIDLQLPGVDCARQWLSEVSTDGEWYDAVYYYSREKLEAIGFDNPEFAFSGFWSQGDGASFTSGIDLTKVLEHLIRETGDHRYEWLASSDNFVNEHLELSVIRGTWRYVHEHSTKVDYDFYARGHGDYAALWAVCKELIEDVEALRLELCRQLYADLEAEYEYLTSDSQLIELADANDYTFDQYGNLER